MADALLAEILKEARKNIDMAAEAEARLAEAGNVSLRTWQRQAAAVEYLTGRQKLQEVEEKKLGQNTVELRKAFGDVGRSALVASAALAGSFAALRHMAGQAHPGYLRAFDGALGILQARLAGSLLPVFDMVIDAVMDAADWFDSLSDGAKQVVAGGMIAVPLLVSLGSALRALSPVLLLASVATKKLTAAALGHSAIGGLVGVAGGAAAAAGTLFALHQIVQADDERQRGLLREQESAQGRVSEDEIRRARETSRRLGYKDTVSDEEFARMGENERRAYMRERAEFLRQRAEAMQRRAIGSTGFLTNLFTGGFLHGRVFTEGEINERRTAAMVFERAAKEGTTVPGEESARRKIRQQAMRVSAMNQESQPKYSPLAEARRQLQLQNLGKNQYEIEILREQRKHRKEEIDRLDRLIAAFRERFPGANLWS